MTEREQILNWAKKYCYNPDLVDEGDFAYAIDQIVSAMAQAGVTSESIDGLSQSFGVNEGGLSIKSILSPYRRAKFL